MDRGKHDKNETRALVKLADKLVQFRPRKEEMEGERDSCKRLHDERGKQKGIDYPHGQLFIHSSLFNYAIFDGLQRFPASCAARPQFLQ
jgi:hypothetical protein